MPPGTVYLDRPPTPPAPPKSPAPKGGKREILDDLFSREAQDWAKWAESVRNQQ